MRNIRIAILAVTTLASSWVWSQGGEEIVLQTETGSLKGTLTVPAGSVKYPVVLIIAGSGPTDRDGNNPVMTNNSLKMLAEGLAEKGIAGLRYDKRGIGASASIAGSEGDLRFETYVEDAEKWAALLREDPRFSELIILGHSEGSLIGMIAARRTKADKFISVAGVGRPAAEILREQLSTQPPAITDMTGPILDTLEMGQTVDNVNPMLNSLFRPSVQPYLISWFKYDPAEEITRLHCPVLILQGTTDIQVKVEDADLLGKANPLAIKSILEGMNHVLKNAPPDRMANVQTYNDPSLPLQEDLVDRIAEFIENQ